MNNIFFILIFIFRITNQLSCFNQCITVEIRPSQLSNNSSLDNTCLENIDALKCYGHLLTYYDRKNDRHILYTLGARKHIIEKKIEEFIDKFHVKTIIYFLFVIGSFYTNEIVISAYIICQIDDNCALNYIIDLVKSYRMKKNPKKQLQQLLYDSKESSELNCYNSETKHIEVCSTQQYSTCMINNTDILEQKCSTDSNIRLEYEFMITLSKKNSIKKIFELVICNITGCNDELVLKQVETIIYNYTLSGMNITFNNSNKLNFYLFNLIYLLILYSSSNLIHLF